MPKTLIFVIIIAVLAIAWLIFHYAGKQTANQAVKETHEEPLPYSTGWFRGENQSIPGDYYLKALGSYVLGRPEVLKILRNPVYIHDIRLLLSKDILEKQPWMKYKSANYRFIKKALADQFDILRKEAELNYIIVDGVLYIITIEH